MEMKLFDIETGKYLELGTDWLYGNEWIGLNLGGGIPLDVKEWASVSYGNDLYGWHGFIGQAIKTKPTGTLKTLCDLTGAVVYGNRYVLTNGKSGQIVERYRFNARGHRDLSEYCLDYIKDTIIYTTPESDLMKDIVISTEIIKSYELDRGYNCENEARQNNDKRWYNYCGERTVEDVNEIEKEIVISTVFEEYSKSLRNEENKLEEIINLIK